jgi:hypothetical protein
MRASPTATYQIVADVSAVAHLEQQVDLTDRELGEVRLVLDQTDTDRYGQRSGLLVALPGLAELAQDVVKVKPELSARGCGGRFDPAVTYPLPHGLGMHLEMPREVPCGDQGTASHDWTVGRASCPR